jgi:hypothetical protein
MSNISYSTENPTTPFGLPTGSVRGIMSVLICAFFWVVLCWPGDHLTRVPLAHFFLLGLVLMAFASNPLEREGEGMAFLPWFLRLLFVGGTIAAVVFAALQLPQQELAERLTPDLAREKDWWIPYVSCTFGGFSIGLFLRYLMGKNNVVFRSMRSWLSVVAMVMLSIEIVLVIVLKSTEGRALEFLHYWNAIELCLVSAYFGTRA